MRNVTRFGLVSTLAAVPVLLIRLRRRINRWGATVEEAGRALPGDDVVPAPDSTSTRAVTVKASVEQVFPWLAQIGQGRGGFYTYDWLENRIGLAIHNADQVLSEYQHLEPGDRIPVAPGPPFYGFLVTEVAAPSRLVLETRMHPFTGLPIPADAPRAGWSLHASWTFVLEPVGDACTRLISRIRTRLSLPLVLGLPYTLLLECVEFVMERRMLLGIRGRAEHASTGAVLMSALGPADGRRRRGHAGTATTC